MSFTREHPAEFLLRRAAAMCCVALVFGYIYLASVSVFHAVMQRTAEQSIEGARTGLAQLGKEYFILSGRVDETAATELGLVKTQGKQFAARTAHVSVAVREQGL